MKKTLCAILCYNNQNTLVKVIKEKIKLRKFCDVIFVNDGSTDNTAKIIDNFKLKTIKHKKNMGYGQAVKTALKYASYKNYHYLAIFPADNQRYIKDLIKMIKIIEKSKFDLIIGSKYRVLEKIPFQRKVGNYFFSYIAKKLWSNKFTDVLSGFKIYRTQAFNKYLNVLPNDYSFDIVLSQLTSFKKIELKELYVRCRYNKDTSSMMGVFKFHRKNIIFIGLKMIFDAIVFLFKYRSKFG